MRLSATAYYADFYLGGAIILALLFRGVVLALADDAFIGLSIWLSFALVGLVAWSLAEYAVHRFAYHRVPFLQRLHDAHHAAPNELIGAPPLIGIIIIFAFGFLPFFAFAPQAACGLTSGLLVGYMAYMLVHHASHYWKPRPGTWLHALRRHHAFHHYRSEDCNFGIITSFWDHVFGTALEPARGGPNRSTA